MSRHIYIEQLERALASEREIAGALRTQLHEAQQEISRLDELVVDLSAAADQDPSEQVQHLYGLIAKGNGALAAIQAIATEHFDGKVRP